MATSKLITRNYKSCRNKDGSSLIFLQYSHGYKTVLLSTGEKVPVSVWDSSRNEVRRSFKGFSVINMVIQRFKEKVDNLAREAKLMGIDPSVGYIKDELSGKKKEVLKVLPLFKFIETYTIEQEEVKKPYTVRSYRTSLRQLKEYRDFLNIPVNYEDIDMLFYENFLKYMFKTRQLSTNSAGSHIKNLKLWLRVSYERGFHKNSIFQNKNFKVLQETSDTIYLNEKELELFYRYDTAGNARLENTRRLLILGAWTGLRYSDIIQLKNENIIDGQYLKVSTQKQNQTVVIPIHKEVKKVFEKCCQETGSPIPKRISNQKFNEYLKELGKAIGLDQTMIVRESKGGKIVQYTYKKYELLSSHCCRRSATTNLYKMGVPSIVIMKITGHTTERNFLKYIKISQENAAEMLKAFWENMEVKS